MYTALIVIGILAIVFSTIPLVFAVKFYKYVDLYFNNKTKADHAPKASLIVPCKGIDTGFKENISALFHQTYTNYELIFVTATDDDPAYPVLSDIISQYPGTDAKLYTSGIVPGRSQKINNQIIGLNHTANDSEIFVFLDSDTRPNTYFIKNLIAPLSDKNIGITTGFRWYLPIKNGIFSFLRSTWNGGGIVFLSNRKSNYAWGGAMAVRRETFYQCDVLSFWENALSDDMTISLAIRKKNLDIYFVPSCLVVTHEDCSFYEMIEWTNRQTIISKVYHPDLWKSILFVHGTGNIILGLGIFLLILCLTSVLKGKIVLFASLLMLSIIPMEMINGIMLLPSIIKMLPEHQKRLKKCTLLYCILAPFASLMALYNSIYSLFTNKITWRGVTYEMKSANETIICNDVNQIKIS